MVINGKCSIQEGVGVRLSGVVSAPHTIHLNFDALDKWIISSFKETRFRNVLQRARVLPQTSWFWHRESNTHISDLAVAIIACNTNDYKQILIKQNQLASAVQELHPKSELLLLISPDQNFVFGTVLETGESFSAHILFTENKEESWGGSWCWECWGSKEVANSNSFERFAIEGFQGRFLTGGGKG